MADIQRARPGCVTVYALLTGLGLVPLCLGLMLLVTGSPKPPIGELLAYYAGAVAIAVLLVVLTMGLWRMKNWARIAVIVLQALVLSLNVGTMVASLFGRPDNGLPNVAWNVPGAILGFLVGGIILYWFAKNRAKFA
ncbi:MAG TPA: hypothetical protein VIU38_10605 [Anaerolineales bacterium]